MKETLENILNKSQMKAIKQSTTSSKAITLIVGPPGTGKTQTTIGLLSIFLCGKKNILLLAPSNGAVDELVRRIYINKLINQNGLSLMPNIIRFGDFGSKNCPIINSCSLN